MYQPTKESVRVNEAITRAYNNLSLEERGQIDKYCERIYNVVAERGGEGRKTASKERYIELLGKIGIFWVDDTVSF
jgi:hypothetical protein